MDIVLIVIGIVLIIVATIIRAIYLMNMSFSSAMRGEAFGGAGILLIPFIAIILALLGSVLIMINIDYQFAILSLLGFWFGAHFVMYLINWFYMRYKDIW